MPVITILWQVTTSTLKENIENYDSQNTMSIYEICNGSGVQKTINLYSRGLIFQIGKQPFLYRYLSTVKFRY